MFRRMSEGSGQYHDWEVIIAAHPLESHDPGLWLRYGVALSQRIEPSSEERNQQQQAGLAFAHAEALGASREAVSKRQTILFSLCRRPGARRGSIRGGAAAEQGRGAGLNTTSLSWFRGCHFSSIHSDFSQ